MWYQNHKKNSNKNKLHRLWKGQGEVLRRVGTNQYSVATAKGEMILGAMAYSHTYLLPLMDKHHYITIQIRRALSKQIHT